MVATASLGSSLSLEKTKYAALNAAYTSLNWKVIKVVARVPPNTIMSPGTLMKLYMSPPRKMAEMINEKPEIIPMK